MVTKLMMVLLRMRILHLPVLIKGEQQQLSNIYLMMGLQTENLILKKEIVQGKGIALKAHILKNNCRTGF